MVVLIRDNGYRSQFRIQDLNDVIELKVLDTTYIGEYYFDPLVHIDSKKFKPSFLVKENLPLFGMGNYRYKTFK